MDNHRFLLFALLHSWPSHAGTARGNGRTTEAVKKWGATPATKKQRNGAAKNQPC